MLMFQQISAPRPSRILEPVDEIHVADRFGRVVGQAAGGHVVIVQAAAVGAVEVQQAGAGPAQVAAQRRQLRDRSHGVAAARLALEPLADPQQRRPGAIPVGGALDGAAQVRR